jgi:N-acetylmuramic acid 6-phosphate (MurNAc-6-P) etherase
MRCIHRVDLREVLPMMNRRQLVHASAVGAALARIPKVLAATYDWVIKGGRVIDPSVDPDAVRDVGRRRLPVGRS